MPSAEGFLLSRRLRLADELILLFVSPRVNDRRFVSLYLKLNRVARKKETKPKMQPGDTVQLKVKGNKATVINARGHKEQYQVVGQAQVPGQ